MALALAATIFAAVSALADSPAVSRLNAKMSVEGGQFDSDEAFLALGSITSPLGYALGLQFDGAIGRVDSETLWGSGVHLFTRDPGRYLIGVYGSYHEWDETNIWRVAGETELYIDRFTITGLAGVENVELPDFKDGLDVLNEDDQHAFGHVDLAFYPLDNLKLYAGYRYVSETSLGAVGAEYLFAAAATPVSIFAEGEFGDDDFSRITGGLKVHFGAKPGKSLIARHRTDDPQNYVPKFPQLQTAGSGNGQLPKCDGGATVSFEGFPSAATLDRAAGCRCACPMGWEGQLRPLNSYICRVPLIPPPGC